MTTPWASNGRIAIPPTVLPSGGSAVAPNLYPAWASARVVHPLS